MIGWAGEVMQRNCGGSAANDKGHAPDGTCPRFRCARQPYPALQQPAAQLSQVQPEGQVQAALSPLQVQAQRLEAQHVPASLLIRLFAPKARVALARPIATILRILRIALSSKKGCEVFLSSDSLVSIELAQP